MILDRGASEFFINTLARFGLPLPFPMCNNSKMKSSFSFDFYMADSFGLIPKKWIDGKKEVFIYDKEELKYYHLIVGEYKEKL